MFNSTISPYNVTINDHLVNSANDTNQSEALIRQRVFIFYYGYHYEIYHALTIIICVLGVITNVLNIIVFNSKEMKNSTNCLLTALSLSDIFVIVTRAPKTVFYYYFTNTNDFVTAFSTSFVYTVAFQYFSVISSNWLSVAIGIWRFIAVTWPLRANELCSIQRAKKVIVGITIPSVLCCLPYFIFFTTEEGTFEGKPIHFITPIKYFGSSYGIFQSTFRALIFFILSLPVFVLIGITAGLMRNMYTASKIRKKLSVSKMGANVQTNRTTLMLTVMLVIFIVNNLPTILTNLGYAFPQFSTRILFIKQTNIFQFFFMLDNTTTFFTYFFMSRKFRRSFYRTFVCHCCTIRRSANLERIRNLSTETTNTICGSTNTDLNRGPSI